MNKSTRKIRRRRRRIRKIWRIFRHYGQFLAFGAVLILVLSLIFCGRDKDSGMGKGDADANTASTDEVVQQIEFMITEPAQNQLMVFEKDFLFRGTSDPGESLTLNGQEVIREADGSFLVTQELKRGINEFVFAHKGETRDFTIEYRHVVQQFAPEGICTYHSGATIYFEVFARDGSTVEAGFNGEVITLEKDTVQAGTGVAEGFACYTGEYCLSENITADLDLGCITYTAVCDGITETYTSGNVTCLQAAEILDWDEAATPSGENYINVGSGYIGEIITFSAETFDGDTIDDYSNPANSYLPEGTVDYCSTQLVELGSLDYVLLRSGHRVYLDKLNSPAGEWLPVVDRYSGQLPDHNEIGVASLTDKGNHLVLTLDCLWKAPFYFDLKPQEYNNPYGSGRDYTVAACTAEYVDITFCYADSFTGTVQLPAGNPLFSSAEVLQNESDYTLRLYLKEPGGFYGWDAYYNDADQLCFQFLKPAKVQASDNAYGADLTGITVMVDVGHGGTDCGAVGVDSSGNEVREADCNLKLAAELKKELESIGAVVILNREDDRQLTMDERIMILKKAAPDFCICMHHNSLDRPDYGGLEVYYFTPFSQCAAAHILEESQSAEVYENSGMNWHYYFLVRETVCPIVLMENGYMTNAFDVANMIDPKSVAQKAQSMTQGIADYFLEINQ